MSGENDNMGEEGNRVQDVSQNELDRIVKEGARKMLAQVLENEVGEYIQKHKHIQEGQCVD